MSKKSKKQQITRQSSSNYNFFLIGTVVFLVVIFVVMASAVLKKDAPAGGNAGGSKEIAQIMDRIETRKERLRENPDDLRLMEDLGNDYYGAGFAYARANDIDQAKFYWNEAIYHYLKVLEKQPDNINVRVDMATISWRADRNDLAEEHFLIAIEQQPDFLFARINFGNYYAYAKQDFENAIIQWEEALKLKPNAQQTDQLKGSIQDAQQMLK